MPHSPAHSHARVLQTLATRRIRQKTLAKDRSTWRAEMLQRAFKLERQQAQESFTRMRLEHELEMAAALKKNLGFKF